MIDRSRKEPTRTGLLRWLWAVLVALLYVSGDRRARRAALRGLMATTLSGVPLGLLRRSGRVEKPSFQGAALGAFATAAALELRTLPTPVGLGSAALTACALGTSLRRGSGALEMGLGIGAALASTRYWPLPPKEGPQAPRAWIPSDAEPSHDGEGLVVAVNKASGNGDDDEAELRELLPRAEIVGVEPQRGDELRKALDARADDAIALGVSGGDGSINTAAQVALDEEKPLVVFPAGTFNHLTGHLGIDTLKDSVTAIEDGKAVELDVAAIDGKVFLNTASFGAYVEFVDARERLERRIGKWPAVVVALARVLRSYDPIEVEIDGEPAKVWMAFIGNCRYHPSGFAPTWRERFDDGMLDFRYVDGSEPWARLRLILAVLTGRLGRSKVYNQSVVERIVITSADGPLRLARDGETFEGSDRVVVEKLPRKLAVYVPEKEAV